MAAKANCGGSLEVWAWAKCISSSSFCSECHPYALLICSSYCGSHRFSLQHAWERQGEEEWPHGNLLTSATGATLLLLGVLLGPKTAEEVVEKQRRVKKQLEKREGPAPMSFISPHSQNSKGQCHLSKTTHTTRSQA